VILQPMMAEATEDRMKLHLTRTIAAFAIVALSATTGVLGEDDRQPDSAAGDWNCRLGGSVVGTLFVRSHSYVLSRSGSTMAGEYQQIAHRVMVTNGPLLGLGIDAGRLVSDADARVLEFLTPNGALLACREVL
jgi:hypothetical protein